ncbi:hypothetical protein J7E81_11785 [Bacillus sp. ISL-18]|uniref:hypothetical protein n=1 Tax=Bacillus sp. ISL-18 TaxID=2819118 RepID=UPI001BE7C358|nr:hypothetical protein [Bacillus sp. ISL-18]MBT2655905.1 hypothetical protein [Bacillus sp. ISL-18]
MRINLSEQQIEKIKRILQKKLFIKVLEPTEESLFIHCYSKIHKETVYYHLFKKKDTLVIRCYARLFDNLGLSEIVRGTAKDVFDYVVNQTGLHNTLYIENGKEITC